MADEDLLTFHYDGLDDSIQRLFDRLGSDEEARERFLDDPTGILASEVSALPSDLTSGERRRANRFVMSLLGNRKFMEWAEHWQVENGNKFVEIDGQPSTIKGNLEDVYRDLTAAMLKYGDGRSLALAFDEEIDETDVETVRFTDDTAPDLLAAVGRAPRRGPIVVQINTSTNVNHTVTLNLAVLALAVIIVIVLARMPGANRVGREDLLNLADSLGDALQERAREVRDAT